MEEPDWGVNYRMWKQRHKFDVYAQILDVASEGVRKSHLVGLARVRFDLIPKYLDPLLKNGLIEELEDVYRNRYFFQTTVEGMEFLKKHEALKGLISQV